MKHAEYMAKVAKYMESKEDLYDKYHYNQP